MKRLILIICLILSCILFINECRHISGTEQTGNMYASKKETAYPENYVPIPKELSNQYKAEMQQMTDEEYIMAQVYPPIIQATYENILDTKYTCYHGDCYDLSSFYYDKQTKTYYIDTLIDLMNWNEHEEHKSPDGNGFVTHLIFRVQVKGDEVSGKCIGYVTGVVVPEYDGNGKFSSFHYRFFGKYKGIPSTIKDIKPFEKSFSIDEIIFNRKIKILADT